MILIAGVLSRADAPALPAKLAAVDSSTAGKTSRPSSRKRLGSLRKRCGILIPLSGGKTILAIKSSIADMESRTDLAGDAKTRYKLPTVSRAGASPQTNRQRDEPDIGYENSTPGFTPASNCSLYVSSRITATRAGPAPPNVLEICLNVRRRFGGVWAFRDVARSRASLFRTVLRESRRDWQSSTTFARFRHSALTWG